MKTPDTIPNPDTTGMPVPPMLPERLKKLLEAKSDPTLSIPKQLALLESRLSAMLTKLPESTHGDDKKRKIEEGIKEDQKIIAQYKGIRRSDPEETRIRTDVGNTIVKRKDKYLKNIASGKASIEELAEMEAFYADPIAFLARESKETSTHLETQGKIKTGTLTPELQKSILDLEKKAADLEYYKKTFPEQYKKNQEKLQNTFHLKLSQVQTNSAEKNKIRSFEEILEDPRGVEVAIHDKDKFDENGEYIGGGWGKPDLDAQGIDLLFDLVGVKYNRLTIVPKGGMLTNTEQLERAQKEHDINFPAGVADYDTSGKDGFIIEADGTIIIDHHDPKRPKRFTSATEKLYLELMKIKKYREKLQKIKGLEEYIELVNNVDNLSYSLKEVDFEKQWPKTLFGVSQNIAAKDVLALCAKKDDLYEPFTKEELKIRVNKGENTPKGVSVASVSHKQKLLVEHSLEGIEAAEKKMQDMGIDNNHPYFKKMLINFVENGKNIIPLGATAAYAKGYDTYIIISTDSVFVSSKEDLTETEKEIAKILPSTLVRGNMIVTDREKSKGNKIDRAEIFKALEVEIDANIVEQKKEKERLKKHKAALENLPKLLTELDTSRTETEKMKEAAASAVNVEFEKKEAQLAKELAELEQELKELEAAQKSS